MGGIEIIKHPVWGKSIRLLIQELGNYYTEGKRKIVLNFGCNIPKNDTIKILNRKISHIKDKIRMNRLLDEYKIRHPKTYYYLDEMPLDSNEKCVIKKQFSQRGNGIIFTTFNKIVGNITFYNMYVQEYIPFEREYRIGIDFKRILGVREKILKVDSYIRNSKTCNYTTIEGNRKLEKFATIVFNKFELDFCGLDIGEYNNKYIVIELNSCPTIGETWARKLSNDLKWLYNVL